jgi:hypothetical protein
LRLRRRDAARMRFTRIQAHFPPPSCPALCRASTPFLLQGRKDVDGRDKPGHDECESLLFIGHTPSFPREEFARIEILDFDSRRPAGSVHFPGKNPEGAGAPFGVSAFLLPPCGGGRLAALQLGGISRPSAIFGAGTMLPGTRTRFRRPPCGCRDAPGTGLAGRLRRMRERVFPARFNPRPAHEGQRACLTRGRLPRRLPVRRLRCRTERAPPHPANKTPHERAPRWVG